MPTGRSESISCGRPPELSLVMALMPIAMREATQKGHRVSTDTLLPSWLA